MAESNENNQEGILEEAVQRFVDAQLRGQQLDIDEYVRQYPDLEHHLRQRIQNLEKIGTLFARLTQADESDFADTATGQNLAGQKVGSFEIAEMIGRGGMGVVYLARDTKLDRPVAIKSMPAELQANSTAQMRFKREAKLLASLNHPNIAVIHEIIEQDDSSGYLVLEYIPGQTLTERIANKPLKIEDALSIGRQIAEALLGAYEQGVIHRDLKPGNIKITPEGRIKVLDFGLAKAFSPHKENSDISITQPGRIVGTPAYMSPEQARGAPTDHRTDIWSFGCVMYEMLTGRLPFEGETATDTVARILERQPDWQALPQNTPTNIRILLRRCLEKNPRQRLQHIGDAVIEINETLNLPANAPPLSGAPEGYSRSALQRVTVAGTVAGIIIGAIAVGITLRSSAPSPVRGLRPTQRSVIPLPEGQTLALSRFTPFGFAQPAIALSPDGSHLVYVANVGTTSQLFLRPMSKMNSSPIPGTEGAFSPFFSPDGRWVGFFTKGKLKKVSLLGGDPVTLCDAGSPRGASWDTDDTIYFAQNQGGALTKVPAAGGATTPLFAGIERPAGGRSCDHPEILPGGKWVLFSRGGYIKLISLETGEIKTLVTDGYQARYLPTGHLVYARAGVLVAVPFDLATLKVSGDAVPVLEHVMLDSTYETVQYTFSRYGMLVYVPGDDTAKSIPAWVNQGETTEPLPMRAQIYGMPKLSPDGKQLAIVVGERSKQDIYVYDVATGTSTRLTLKGNNSTPVWTPDGKRVTFLRHGQGVEKSSIFWKSGDGSGEAELLHSSDHTPIPFSWASNGKRLAFFTGGIWVLPLEGPREPELIIDTEATEWAPAFSPDGRWIAYTSNRDGKCQIYVRPYPDNDWVRQISYDFGEEPVWSPKGDKLFYRNGDKWMVVSISTELEFTAGTPQVLFEGPYNNVPDLSYDVAPDGRFLVLQPEHDDSEVRELHVVTNWFEELKRLVPVDGE
ncbi:MAG: protein kinase domain-containing protein [Planctomycetota bacterium]|jgi:serine/threonine-protein kinase